MVKLQSSKQWQRENHVAMVQAIQTDCLDVHYRTYFRFYISSLKKSIIFLLLKCVEVSVTHIYDQGYVHTSTTVFSPVVSAAYMFLANS